MSELAMKQYFEMLAQKIVQLYDVTAEVAIDAVSRSSIQTLIRKYPEHVGHVSVYDWAQEIYEEIIIRC